MSDDNPGGGDGVPAAGGAEAPAQDPLTSPASTIAGEVAAGVPIAGELTATPIADPCLVCGRALKPQARFCAECGSHRIVVGPPPALKHDLKMVLSLYATTLVVMAGWLIYMRITDAGFTTVIGSSLSLAVITVAFSVANRPLIQSSLDRPGFGPLGYVLIIAASIPIMFLVVGYVTAISRWFGIHVPGELEEFAGHHVLWPIVIVVIIPPLVEELAFRGLIFGGLRKSLTVGEAMIVSSAAFAIMHLSVPALVTHFPLGLYFCWLRHRSASLWPGVLAHCCHNLGVLIVDWM